MEDQSNSAQEQETEEAGGDLLTFEESRVLGCLLEKQVTTPEYYPMTRNALMAACNQKSNRNPVTEFEEATVDETLDGLREKKIAVMISVAGSRVPKFKHIIESAYGSLDPSQTAILCVLLLRGAQTVGELKGRTERMHRFSELSDVEEVLGSLMDRPYGTVVKMLPPGGGRKVKTFYHLLCGDVVVSDGAAESAPAAVHPAGSSWRRDLEEEVASLRTDVSLLRNELDEFKQQFG